MRNNARMNIVADSPRPAKPYVSQWLENADALLDVHRSRFLFQEPSAAELELHKSALEMALQRGALLNSIVESADVTRRLMLLSDAYRLFHAPTFPEKEAEELLSKIFPE
jgi:hypothetical protein